MSIYITYKTGECQKLKDIKSFSLRALILEIEFNDGRFTKCVNIDEMESFLII